MRWKSVHVMKATQLRGLVHDDTMKRMSLLFLAIGLAAGALSGLFGIGGGILIVPALLLFGKMDPASATGTSLGALLLPVGALGAWEYHRHGHVNVTAALLIALGIFVGAYCGARFGQELDPATAKRAFAVLLVLVAAQVWFTA
jgi:uncharacterized membrane protein YfcA